METGPTPSEARSSRSPGPARPNLGPHTALRFGAAVILLLGAFPAVPGIPLGVGGGRELVPQRSHRRDPVYMENLRKGTDAWRIGLHGDRVADDRLGQIKGYATAVSVEAGEPITFRVSVSPPQTYDVAVYRMGWYRGLGGRLMWQRRSLGGITQPTCPTDPDTGLIVCRWSDSVTLRTGGSWLSGVYLAVLTNERRYQNYIIFVVRNDHRAAPLLVQVPLTTYQAYNLYPEGTTGEDLYRGFSVPGPAATGGSRAVKVSFDRPFAGAGDGHFFAGSFNVIRWLERFGYDVTYTTSIDTDLHPDRLLAFRGLISIAHDEYWSKAMFDAAVAARDHGVSLAFLGANDVYRQVRFGSSPTGPDRVMTCYKDAALDPIHGLRTTVEFRAPPVNRPEQTLIGVQFVSRGVNEVTSGKAPWIAQNTWSWAFEGTGMRAGDSIPDLVSLEYDSVQPGQHPPNRTFLTLASSPVEDFQGRQLIANTTLYQAPSGAWVFAAGTLGWPEALDGYGGGRADARVQLITANILDRFISRRPVTTPTLAWQPTRIEPGSSVRGGAISVLLQWEAIPGPQIILGYQLQESVDGRAFVNVRNTPASSFARLSLLPGTVERFRVRAHDEEGDVSAWADSPPLQVVTVDSLDAQITTGGYWRSVRWPGAFGRTVAESQSGTTWALWSFRGRSVALLAPRAPGRGWADVSIDGRLVDVVLLSSPRPTPPAAVFTWSWPVAGHHTIVVWVAPTSPQAPIDIDAFLAIA